MGTTSNPLKAERAAAVLAELRRCGWITLTREVYGGLRSKGWCWSHIDQAVADLVEARQAVIVPDEGRLVVLPTSPSPALPFSDEAPAEQKIAARRNGRRMDRTPAAVGTGRTRENETDDASPG
jgi:hypothetical protein